MTDTSSGRRVALALLAACALAAGSPLAAQAPRGTVAAPFYTTADAMTGLARHWALPRANAFRANANTLVDALRAHCDAVPANASRTLERSRTAWNAAVDAWERLSTVPAGPLIERRSAQRVDFQPARPELVRRAIATGPDGWTAFDRIGAPAKGLPALEGLLWTAPVAPATPGCAYAVAAASDVAVEATALDEAYARWADLAWEGEAADAGVSEFVNQWIGAVDRLRWRGIERPLREADARGKGALPAFPRAASGGSAASRARQWATLRELAVAASPDYPAPGSAMLPLETLLRARGQLALATRWLGRTERTDAAFAPRAGTPRARLDAAARALAGQRQLAQDEVAPALRVTVGFSDADGD